MNALPFKHSAETLFHAMGEAARVVVHGRTWSWLGTPAHAGAAKIGVNAGGVAGLTFLATL